MSQPSTGGRCQHDAEVRFATAICRAAKAAGGPRWQRLPQPNVTLSTWPLPPTRAWCAKSIESHKSSKQTRARAWLPPSRPPSEASRRSRASERRPSEKACSNCFPSPRSLFGGSPLGTLSDFAHVFVRPTGEGTLLPPGARDTPPPRCGARAAVAARGTEGFRLTFGLWRLAASGGEGHPVTPCIMLYDHCPNSSRNAEF